MLLVTTNRADPRHRRGTVVWRRIVGTLALGAGAILGLASPAAAATVGVATVMTPDQLKLINTGRPDTVFSLNVPAGARCSGDAAHDGYRVESYVLPKGTDPAKIVYKGENASAGYMLVNNGDPYFAVNTEPNTAKVIFLPTQVSWSRYGPAELLPGGVKSATWEVGLACASPKGNATQIWNTEFVFTADATVPGGYVWSLAIPQKDHTHVPWAEISVFAILAATGGVVWVLLGRDRRAAEAHG